VELDKFLRNKKDWRSLSIIVNDNISEECLLGSSMPKHIQTTLLPTN
jgi:hypothetical protein